MALQTGLEDKPWYIGALIGLVISVGLYYGTEVEFGNVDGDPEDLREIVIASTETQRVSIYRNISVVVVP